MSNHITNTYKESTHLLKAMAHPVRLAILDILLKNEEECVCHLEAVLGYRQAYLSQHLMALREAGLVVDRREGRNIFYRIRSPDLLRFASQVLTVGGSHLLPADFNAITCTCPKCTQKSPELIEEAKEKI